MDSTLDPAPALGRGRPALGPEAPGPALRVPQAAQPDRRGARPGAWKDPTWTDATAAPPDVLTAVVLSASWRRPRRCAPAKRFTLPASAFAWTRRLSRGRRARRRHPDRDADERRRQVEAIVAQDPNVEGAAVILENATGAVRARRRLRLQPLSSTARSGAAPGRLRVQARRLPDGDQAEASRPPTPSSTRRSRSRSTRSRSPGSRRISSACTTGSSRTSSRSSTRSTSRPCASTSSSGRGPCSTRRAASGSARTFSRTRPSRSARSRSRRWRWPRPTRPSRRAASSTSRRSSRRSGTRTA